MRCGTGGRSRWRCRREGIEPSDCPPALISSTRAGGSSTPLRYGGGVRRRDRSDCYRSSCHASNQQTDQNKENVRLIYWHQPNNWG